MKRIKVVAQKNLMDREDIAIESLSLGGRTRVNGGLYLPGCRAEYENWGNGWQWDDIAPFFCSEGRLEMERGTIQSAKREGGEYKTRIIGPEYESSRQQVII